MTTAPTASRSLIVIDALSEDYPRDHGKRYIELASTKLGRGIANESGRFTSVVSFYRSEGSLQDLIHKNMRTSRDHDDTAVIVIAGDFSPTEWDALVAEFPDVEMCNVTSADLAA